MGRETKSFKQNGKSMQGNQGAQNYAKINRGAWHTRLINYIKVRGKFNNGQS